MTRIGWRGKSAFAVTARTPARAPELGRTLKEVVNDALRAGLDALEEPKPRPRKQYTTPMDLGEPLVPIDDISAALDLLDEDEWRRKLR